MQMEETQTAPDAQVEAEAGRHEAGALEHFRQLDQMQNPQKTSDATLLEQLHSLNRHMATVAAAAANDSSGAGPDAARQHGASDSLVRDQGMTAQQASDCWDAIHQEVQALQCGVGTVSLADPVTCDLMVDPVVCSDGRTYCRWSAFELLDNGSLLPGCAGGVFSIWGDNVDVRSALFEAHPHQQDECNSRRTAFLEGIEACVAANDLAAAEVRLARALQWLPHRSAAANEIQAQLEGLCSARAAVGGCVSASTQAGGLPGSYGVAHGAPSGSAPGAASSSHAAAAGDSGPAPAPASAAASTSNGMPTMQSGNAPQSPSLRSSSSTDCSHGRASKPFCNVGTEGSGGGGSNVSAQAAPAGRRTWRSWPARDEASLRKQAAAHDSSMLDMSQLVPLVVFVLGGSTVHDYQQSCLIDPQGHDLLDIVEGVVWSRTLKGWSNASVRNLLGFGLRFWTVGADDKLVDVLAAQSLKPEQLSSDSLGTYLPPVAPHLAWRHFSDGGRLVLIVQAAYWNGWRERVNAEHPKVVDESFTFHMKPGSTWPFPDASPKKKRVQVGQVLQQKLLDVTLVPEKFAIADQRKISQAALDVGLLL